MSHSHLTLEERVVIELFMHMSLSCRKIIRTAVFRGSRYSQGKIMEQKGTLWIIAAVGIFLLAVLLPAIILFKPDTHKVQMTGRSPNLRRAVGSRQGHLLLPAALPKTEQLKAMYLQIKSIPKIRQNRKPGKRKVRNETRCRWEI